MLILTESSVNIIGIEVSVADVKGKAPTSAITSAPGTSPPAASEGVVALVLLFNSLWFRAGVRNAQENKNKVYLTFRGGGGSFCSGSTSSGEGGLDSTDGVTLRLNGRLGGSVGGGYDGSSGRVFGTNSGRGDENRSAVMNANYQ